MFDYSELRGRIKTVFNTEEAFAQAIGLSKGAVAAKLNNKARWKTEEMIKVCKVLRVDKSNIVKFFFEEKV